MKGYRATSIRALCAAMMVALVIAGGGCGKKKPMAFVATWPTVQWNDIARSGGTDNSGYNFTLGQRTTGLFPSALAVARVRAVDDMVTVDPATRLELDLTPEVDFLAWNRVFDDIRDISEVFPLSYAAMDGAPISVDAILTGAAAQRAGLCLIYAQVLESVYDARFRGVLYDVKQRRQLAVIHSAAHVQDPIALDDEDDYESRASERESRDPRLVATRQFEQFMRELLLNLRANDDSQAPVTPEGWVPQYMQPAIWPPVDWDSFNRSGGRR